MARHSTVKLHPSLFSTERAPLGFPLVTLQLPPATNVPQNPTLSNRPLRLEAGKPACVYPGNAQPRLRSLEPRTFQSAASPWEENGQAAWAHRIFAGNRRKANVHMQMLETYGVSSDLEERNSSPLIHAVRFCPTPVLQPHALPEAVRVPQGIDISQPIEYASPVKAGEGVSHFRMETIPHMGLSSYFVTPDPRPLPVATPLFSKGAQNAVDHSASVSTEVARSHGLVDKTRTNVSLSSSGTASESTAMHAKLAAPCKLRFSSGIHMSEGKQIRSQISSQHASERGAPLSSKGFTSSHIKLQSEAYSPACLSAETSGRLGHQKEINVRLRGGECRPPGEKCETRLSHLAGQVYANPRDSSANTVQIRSGSSKALGGKGKMSFQVNIGEGLDSRESTSSTASPTVLDVHKSGCLAQMRESETNTPWHAKHQCSYTGANSTEVRGDTYFKEPLLHRNAHETVPTGRTPTTRPSKDNTPVPPQKDHAGESGQFPKNGCYADCRVPFGGQMYPLYGSAGSQAHQPFLPTGEPIQMPQTAQLPHNIILRGAGEVGQSGVSVQCRQHLVTKGQSGRMEISSARSFALEDKPAPPVLPSTQKALLNLQSPNIDKLSCIMQSHEYGVNCNLPLGRQEKLSPHSVLAKPSQSQGVNVPQTQGPATLHRPFERNTSGSAQAISPEVSHIGLTSPLASDHALAWTPSVPVSRSTWRDPPNKDESQSNASRSYFQKKLSPAKTKGRRRDYGILRPVRPVFKRMIPHLQTSTTVRADGRAREQIRNRAVLERVASAGVTVAAATAAGTLLASTSPAIAGLAVAGVAALLTGLAAASSTADNPQCYRRPHRRQVPATPYSTYERGATDSTQDVSHESYGPWSLVRSYAAPRCPETARKHAVNGTSQAPQMVSHSSRKRNYSLNKQSYASRVEAFGPLNGDVKKPLPLPEVLAMKSYGTKPHASGILLLVGRPVKPGAGH